jgi:hypothetical protein
METNLPSLDIVDDIAEVMSDDLPSKIEEKKPETINMDVEEEDDSPFIKAKPVKKKKELSEKQKAHLDKIRKLALEKKQAKMKAKQEALEKVDEEHKAKHYKPRRKKTEEQKDYEKKTTKIDDTEPREKQVEKKATPDDFVPSHKEEIKRKKEQQLKDEENAFMNFMGNMEKYLLLKDNYDRKKRAKNSKTNLSKSSSNNIKQTPKPTPKPAPLVPEEPPNPYAHYFG